MRSVSSFFSVSGQQPPQRGPTQRVGLPQLVALQESIPLDHETPPAHQETQRYRLA
jgi:hypothetical protein